MIRTVKRSSDRIDLLQHHRSLTACIEYIIDRKHVEESQADGENHKTMRVVTSLTSGSIIDPTTPSITLDRMGHQSAGR